MSTSFRLTAIETRRYRLAVWVAALAAPAIGWAVEPVGLTEAAEPTARAQREVPEKFLRSAKPVPNHYVVVLKDDALKGKSGLTASSDGQEGDGLVDEDAMGRRVEEVSARLASAHNGRIGYVYKYTIRGFSVEMTEEQARALSANPEVKYVEEETEASLQSSQVNAPWGLDRIDQRTLPLNTRYDYFPTGDQVNVYVIDTGIRFSHSEFGGRATVGQDFVNDGRNGDDCNGHGTHVAGIIGGKTYGVAKDARLISVRIFNCSAKAHPGAREAAIDWVTKNHSKPAVVNMSLTVVGTAAADAIRDSISKGITYVISAGNTNATSPVSVDEAIVVGATDGSDVRPTWWPWCDAKDKNCGSNYGPAVDVFAPGVDIVSAWPDGVALDPDFEMVNTTPGSRAASMSGTSQAAPHVTGVAALYLQMGADPGVIQQEIIGQSVTGAVIDPGPGSPNRLLQTRLGGVYFADVDNDQRADAIVVGDNKITVRRSNGATFGPNESWTTNPYFGNRGTFFADVDKDGQADAIAVNAASFPPNTHTVTVRRSNGLAFLANENWGSDPSNLQLLSFADVNNDDKADKIMVYGFGIRVRKSTGNGFGPIENWTNGPYFGARGTFFADVDKDGQADAIAVNGDKITVRRSNGSGFGPNESWTTNPYFGNRGTFFADVDKDGLADAIAVNDDGVTVRRSNGSGFGPNESWTTNPYYGNRATAFADVHGDGNADAIAVNDDGVTVRISGGKGNPGFHSGWFLPTGPYYSHW